jgi:hypothetical protein
MSSLKARLRRHKLYYRPRRVYRKLLYSLAKRDPFPDEFVEKKVIYIHIPKSAGNAVTESIFGKPSLELAGHTFARHFLGARPELFRNCVKFTFSRHPVDRFISAYAFLKRGGMTEMDAAWAEAFLSDCPDIHRFIGKMHGSFFRREVMDHIHFIPQWKFVSDKTGACIIDFLGKYENLAEDFAKVSAIIGSGKPLTEVNTSDRAFKHAQSVDERETNFVMDLYKKDMAFFDYDDAQRGSSSRPALC